METFRLANWMVGVLGWAAMRAFVFARWLLSWTGALAVGIVGLFVHRGLVTRRARRIK